MMDDEPRGRLEDLRRRALEDGEVPDRIAQAIQEAVDAGATLEEARSRILLHVASEPEIMPDPDIWLDNADVIARLLRSYAPTLADDAVARMARLFERVRFEPGDEIIRQGEPGDALYLLQSGEVEVTRSAFGRGSAVAPAHVATLGTGAVVGEMSLIYSRPRNANVVALSRIAAFRLDKSGWIHLQAQYPVFAARIVEVARQRAETLGPAEEGGLSVDI